MIRSVAETGGIAPPVATTPTTKATASDGTFAAELDKQAKKPTPSPKAPKNEKTDPVQGHLYSEVIAGPRNGMFINTSGNERHGQAFMKVERDGRTFHIYGTGADRKVFEVKPEPPQTTPAAAAPAPTPPVAAAPTAAATTPPLKTPLG